MSDDLLARLAAALQDRDPVPAGVLLGARCARTAGRLRPGARWLPELPGGRAGMRGGTGQVLDFGALLVSVDRAADGTVALSGLLADHRPGDTLVACRPDGEHSLAVDEIGGFAAGGLPTGPLCLAVLRPGEPAAVTPWFVT